MGYAGNKGSNNTGKPLFVLTPGKMLKHLYDVFNISQMKGCSRVSINLPKASPREPMLATMGLPESGTSALCVLER